MRIHIGVFAHNEQDHIAAVLQDLARQDLFARPDAAVRVFVLANGCRDATVRVARETVASLPPETGACFTVLDLPLGGKSRTWNHFVHDLCAGTDFIYCVDGDIRIPEARNLGRMLACMDDPALWVVNSRPRKDLEVTQGARTPVERAIVMASGSGSDYRNSISGQLYLARTAAVQGVHMPVGLPVEDGFLRAMVLTRLLTEPEDLRRIHGEPDIWHIYESIRTIPELVKHQTRIVIGSAVNTAIFDHMRAHAGGYEARSALLREVAQDDAWLGRMLHSMLPRWPSGFVPVHFLVKRLEALGERDGTGLARRLAVTTAGFALDALVYVNAQWMMARGKGAGHW